MILICNIVATLQKIIDNDSHLQPYLEINLELTTVIKRISQDMILSF